MEGSKGFRQQILAPAKTVIIEMLSPVFSTQTFNVLNLLFT